MITREQFVRWIGVNEKKPPIYKEVLLSDGESIWLGCYYGSNTDGSDMWGSDGNRVLDGITHWMFQPLPPNAVVEGTMLHATLSGIPEDGVFKGPNQPPDEPIRFEIGTGEALPFDPTPRGDKSLSDYQRQLKAKRKRKNHGR